MLLSVYMLLIACNAGAAVLTLGVLQRADDERLDPKRVEWAYPGQPGGSLAQAVETAARESQFELDAARLQVKVETRSARDADDAKAQLAQLAKAGAAAVVLDLPGAWIATAAAGTRLALLNAGSADEGPRQQACLGNLFHTLPGERMRADALAQTLLARRWS